MCSGHADIMWQKFVFGLGCIKLFPCFAGKCFTSVPIVGYDVRRWCAKAGAWEEQVAVEVATSPPVDLNLIAPNGNRLSQMSHARKPAWVDRTCEKLATALRETSSLAVAFVGSAALSPGLANFNIYETLIPMVHLKLQKLQVAVVTEAPGVVLADDGIHWRVTSATAVARLIDVMVTNATDTALIQRGAPPNLWHWRYNVTRQRHYPC